MTTQTTLSTLAAFVVDADTRTIAIKAMVKASKAHDAGHAKVDRTLVESLIEAARALGCEMTEDMWNAQFAKPARKAMKAKLAASSLSSAMTRAKCVTLAACTRPANWAELVKAAEVLGETLVHFSDPLGGEGINAYVKRVGPMLDSAKLSDGTWVRKHAEDGTLAPRSGPTRSETTPESVATDSAGDAAKAEGGQNVSKELAAARILMGTTPLADTLVLIAGNYRDQFSVWAAAILADAETAKTVLGTTSNRVRVNRANAPVN